MLRQNHTNENENDLNSQNNEEQRENRLRSPLPPSMREPVAAPTPQSNTPLAAPRTLAERVSPKTQEMYEGRERVKSTHKPTTHRANNMGSNKGKQSGWFAENVTNNPMYHKELLAGRRVLELRTPLQRFLTMSTPFVVLGCVYYSIYYAISWFYNEAYYRFVEASADPSNSLYPMTQLPGASATKHALEQSMAASGVSYIVLLTLQALIVGIGIPLMAAMKITSEREKMNWNSLLMSRLTPAQILIGKASPVLRMTLLVNLVVLPALLITGLMTILPLFSPLQSSGGQQFGTGAILTYFGRAFFLPQIIIAVTAVLNTAIALYFSLTQKKSLQANAGAMRWTTLSIVGPAGLTGLFYAIPTLIAFLTNSQTSFSIDPWIHPLLFAPNIFSPLGALIASMIPSIAFYNPNYPNTNPDFSITLWAFLVGIAPFVYVGTASGMILRLWRKMLAAFEHAPKDASG
jgi:hypothetical protein